MLPEKLQALLNQELQPGETLRWSGQPCPGRHVRRAIPISFAGIVVAIIGLACANGFKIPDLRHGNITLTFFSAIPLLVALILLLAPLWSYLCARHTVYAVTSNRALILHPGLCGNIKIRSLGPGILHDIIRTQKPDGSGDLVFVHDTANPKDQKHAVPIGFFGIPDVREVERLLTTMRGENLCQSSTQLPE